MSLSTASRTSESLDPPCPLFISLPAGHSPRLAPSERLGLLLSRHPANRYCTSISATLLTPLSAITRFPSFVGIMFRTTPPPEGMVQVWNFSVFGSKRTRVFGLTADSLYQMMSL